MLHFIPDFLLFNTRMLPEQQLRFLFGPGPIIALPGLNEIALSKVVDIVADAENDVAESQMAKIVWANFVQIPGQKQDQKPLLLGKQFFKSHLGP